MVSIEYIVNNCDDRNIYNWKLVPISLKLLLQFKHSVIVECKTVVKIYFWALIILIEMQKFNLFVHSLTHAICVISAILTALFLRI
jgi:hypothetical protein